MATTMRLIGKVSLGADAASIEFNSIPGSGYTDLLVILSLRSDRASAVADWVKLRFNGATADTNHSARALYGDGASAASLTDPSARIGYAPASTSTASTFGSFEVYLPNYAGSSNKSYSATGVAETNGTTQFMAAVAGLWSSTAAITDIKVMPDLGSNFKSGSSAQLFGIVKA